MYERRRDARMPERQNRTRHWPLPVLPRRTADAPHYRPLWRPATLMYARAATAASALHLEARRARRLSSLRGANSGTCLLLLCAPC